MGRDIWAVGEGLAWDSPCPMCLSIAGGLRVPFFVLPVFLDSRVAGESFGGWVGGQSGWEGPTEAPPAV